MHYSQTTQAADQSWLRPHFLKPSASHLRKNDPVLCLHLQYYKVTGTGKQMHLEMGHWQFPDRGTSQNWLHPDPPGREGAAKVPLSSSMQLSWMTGRAVGPMGLVGTWAAVIQIRVWTGPTYYKVNHLGQLLKLLLPIFLMQNRNYNVSLTELP